MNEGEPMAVHPDLEHYYDTATDRAAADAHLADCGGCRAWLEDIHERLGGLACIEFVELVTEYLEDAIDTELRRRIDDHLRLCEGCRNYLDEMRTTIATIGRTVDVSDPSDAVRAGLMAAFRAWQPAAPDRRLPGD
jgi:predicted anti-sigma-YlaC factor YlaD